MRRPTWTGARSRARAGVTGLTVLAACGLFTIVVSGPAHAAYPGADGLIAFVRHGDIYTINPQSLTPGATVRRLTRDGRDSGPRWSPDGKQLAYLDRGNLWIMRADGSHKRQITSRAPAYTDARPTWSPNGRYLAFVRTGHRSRYGYLTRYDTLTRTFATFSTPYHSESPTVRQIKVTALPTAVAWAWARDATGVSRGSFLIFEGATAPRCPSASYCLDALGFPAQADYRNGFPSAENTTAKPVRLLDPDWYPNDPMFSLSVLTSQARCLAGHCSPTGVDLTIGAAPILPGGYQAVYSPSGGYLAYVLGGRSGPVIYLYSPAGTVPLPARALISGTQPDWQPVRPAPV